MRFFPKPLAFLVILALITFGASSYAAAAVAVSSTVGQVAPRMSGVIHRSGVRRSDLTFCLNRGLHAHGHDSHLLRAEVSSEGSHRLIRLMTPSSGAILAALDASRTFTHVDGSFQSEPLRPDTLGFLALRI